MILVLLVLGLLLWHPNENVLIHRGEELKMLFSRFFLLYNGAKNLSGQNWWLQPEVREKCPGVTYLVCGLSCISKGKLTDWIIPQVTGIWNKTIATTVKKEVNFGSAGETENLPSETYEFQVPWENWARGHVFFWQSVTNAELCVTMSPSCS